ncbi:hypothetical protein PENTCL1PPCAC_19629, partial [Pristionchus entomophagus]
KESKYFVERLVIGENMAFEKEMIVKSFVLGLVKSCMSLHMSLDYVTPETIHEVYKIMIDGTSKLREFGNRFIPSQKWIKCLKLIGITFKDGKFFSNKDIEVYKVDNDDGRVLWFIFDGNVEIVLEDDIFAGYFVDVAFTLKLHYTQDSIKEAKRVNRIQRVEIGPE